jgi:molecular chaperone DnaK (HSP70)
MKATLVQPGKPFSIVENSASKRKTEAMVTLGNENRIFGADSFLESGKYPKSTFQELARTFGEKYDYDLVQKFKEERFVTNELVADQRGYVGWKITRAAYDKEAEKEEILYSEEVLAMLLAYVKFLAEKQAGGSVRDCVITIPSWFTYDQRLMVKDAAEGLAGLNILQLVHENTAAATMFGIDQKLEKDKNLTVMFYNMGGMDTEVSII